MQILGDFHNDIGCENGSEMTHKKDYKNTRLARDHSIKNQEEIMEGVKDPPNRRQPSFT